VRGSCILLISVLAFSSTVYSNSTGETGISKSDVDSASSSSSIAQSGANLPQQRPLAVTQATEIPPGVLFGTFTKEDGPFLIMGSIIVPAGQVLTFGPGSEIFMGGDYSTITIFGQLIANGTPGDPVVFQSAYADPNPWDWDRIYCRSRNRSEFEHCIIRHSNYGVVVENGLVKIEGCIFERNSLHGLVVTNSDALVYNTTFRRGHVLALFCRAGASVRAESLLVIDNITGIGCENKSHLSVDRGVIRGNRNGIAVHKGASVSVVAADIERNKIGVASETELPKKMLEMVYGNGIDVKVVDAEDMADLLKPPEGVKSIVLPKGKTDVRTSDSFEAGFAALKAPREPVGGFIGNVEAGFNYYMPDSKRHPVSDTLIHQTRYLGEQSDKWYAGAQPELNLFLQGKRGEADVNLNADLFANQWVNNDAYLDRNLFTLSFNYSDQSLVFGDFYQNMSETSMSGRRVSGVRYKGSALAMGRGTDRLDFELAFGESEAPKDTGDNEPNVFNQVVDSGLSLRQQLTYVAGVSVKPTFNSVITARGIIARDQTMKSLFGRTVSDPKAPEPIASQTGVLEGSVVLLQGALELRGEVDLGTHDTVAVSDYDDIAWYNPDIRSAVPRVFGLLTPDSNNYAISFGGTGRIREYDLGITITEIAPNYFSAGNPYLEADRRYVTLSGERRFMEKLELNAEYEYERTSVSNVYNRVNRRAGPVDENSLTLAGTYEPGEKWPGFGLDYDIAYRTGKGVGRREVIVWSVQNSGDTLGKAVDSAMLQVKHELRNTWTLEAKQRFENGIDYTVKYRLLWDNDFTDYVDPMKMNENDGLVNEISGRFGFKIKRLIRNKFSGTVRFKNEVRDSLESFGYKVSNDFQITAIPRKLSFGLKGEYQRKTDSEYEREFLKRHQELFAFIALEPEAKYSVTSKLAATLSGRYERLYDENEGAENYTLKVGGLRFTYLF